MKRVNSIPMNLLLAFGSLCLVFAAVEGSLRFFVRESRQSHFGALRGQALPPLRVIVPNKIPELQPDKWFSDLVVNGKKITYSDLWGLMREHSVVGYVPRENAQSTNGWWQSNNIGARTTADTSTVPPQGMRRILVFGDSFTQGSRLPLEETWIYRLNRSLEGWEVLNFGVDGYSMAQALLRFNEVRKKLSYDLVVFVHVPRVDLWRDINVIRYLGENWGSFAIAPRYILKDDALEFVAPPYAMGTDIYKENIVELRPEVREHLRAYDRFYVPWLYESPPIIGNFLSYKLFALRQGRRQSDRIKTAAFQDPHSEAMRVSTAIFLEAQRLAHSDGADFQLLALPTRFKLQTQAQSQLTIDEEWQNYIAALEAAELPLYDLRPFLLQHVSELDASYDGTHYGKEGSRLIATVVEAAIGERFHQGEPEPSQQ